MESKQLEALINWHGSQITEQYNQGNRQKAIEHQNEMVRLIRMRDPEQIKLMEKEMGLG